MKEIKIKVGFSFCKNMLLLAKYLSRLTHFTSLYNFLLFFVIQVLFKFLKNILRWYYCAQRMRLKIKFIRFESFVLEPICSARTNLAGLIKIKSDSFTLNIEIIACQQISERMTRCVIKNYCVVKRQ